MVDELMRAAIEEAKRGFDEDETSIGAALTCEITDFVIDPCAAWHEDIGEPAERAATASIQRRDPTSRPEASRCWVGPHSSDRADSVQSGPLARPAPSAGRPRR
jgi:hypothetical protein